MRARRRINTSLFDFGSQTKVIGQDIWERSFGEILAYVTADSSFHWFYRDEEKYLMQIQMRESERKIKLQIVCGRRCVKGSSVKATIDWECHKRYFEPHSAFPACWNRKSDFEGSHLRQSHKNTIYSETTETGGPTYFCARTTRLSNALTRKPLHILIYTIQV